MSRSRTGEGRRRDARRGTVLIAVVVAMVMLQVVVAAVIISGARDLDIAGRSVEVARSLYAGEAGMNMALRELANNLDEDADGAIGSISNNGVAGDDPNLSGGRVYVTQSKVASTTTMISNARCGQAVRTVTALAEDSGVSAQSFTGSGIGTTYTTFAQLHTGYTTFIGATTGVINFTGLTPGGTIVTNQYTASNGITFSNTAGTHGSRIEQGAVVGVLDGYDGTFRPSGDRLYVSQPNTSAATPFTFVFTSPMGRVGSFLGMGPEGAIATFTVKLYDASDVLLDTLTVTTAAWTNAAAREGFFGHISASANIKKVTILNNSTTVAADRMLIDEVIWSATGSGVGSTPRLSSWAEQ